MNDRERDLIRWICEGDMRKTKIAAKLYLEGVTAKKDKDFVERSIRKLENQGNFIALPANMERLLVAEESSLSPTPSFF